MKRKIIMVNGKKRAGKDFFSDMLIEKSFVKLSIAQNLKDLACEIANIDFDTMEDLKNNEHYFEIDRYLFQQNFKFALFNVKKKYYDNISNELIENIEKFNPLILDIVIKNDDKDPNNSHIIKIDARKFLQNMNIFKILFEDDDIWIKMLLKDMSNITEDIVIADFRFPNEFTSVKKEFKNDNVISLKIIGKNYYDKDKYDTHPSETSLDDWKFDYHINNTIWHNGSLFWQVSGLLQELDILEYKEEVDDSRI